MSGRRCAAICPRTTFSKARLLRPWDLVYIQSVGVMSVGWQRNMLPTKVRQLLLFLVTVPDLRLVLKPGRDVGHNV